MIFQASTMLSPTFLFFLASCVELPLLWWVASRKLAAARSFRPPRKESGPPPPLRKSPVKIKKSSQSEVPHAPRKPHQASLFIYDVLTEQIEPVRPLRFKVWPSPRQAVPQHPSVTSATTTSPPRPECDCDNYCDNDCDSDDDSSLGSVMSIVLGDPTFDWPVVPSEISVPRPSFRRPKKKMTRGVRQPLRRSARLAAKSKQSEQSQHSGLRRSARIAARASRMSAPA